MSWLFSHNPRIEMRTGDDFITKSEHKAQGQNFLADISYSKFDLPAGKVGTTDVASIALDIQPHEIKAFRTAEGLRSDQVLEIAEELKKLDQTRFQHNRAFIRADSGSIGVQIKDVPGGYRVNQVAHAVGGEKSHVTSMGVATGGNFQAQQSLKNSVIDTITEARATTEIRVHKPGLAGWISSKLNMGTNITVINLAGREDIRRDVEREYDQKEANLRYEMTQKAVKIAEAKYEKEKKIADWNAHMDELAANTPIFYE